MEEGLQTNKFNNLNIFITGASSGIGLAVSKLFLRMGSNVYAIDNNKMNDQEFMSNNNGNFFLSDICDYKNMNNIIKKILQKVINIDILINCAGIIDFKSIEVIGNIYEYENPTLLK